MNPQQVSEPYLTCLRNEQRPQSMISPLDDTHAVVFTFSEPATELICGANDTLLPAGTHVVVYARCHVNGPLSSLIADTHSLPFGSTIWLSEACPSALFNMSAELNKRLQPNKTIASLRIETHLLSYINHLNTREGSITDSVHCQPTCDHQMDQYRDCSPANTLAL